MTARIGVTFKAPVLFLVFNRPETTKRVFEAIKKARPPRLYVACDGPRGEKGGEADLVKLVRKIAIDVDWPCELFTLFRDSNLGCGNAVSNAISWFFKNEEMGIILEDDCLPSPSFFEFCSIMLDKYKNENRIMMVSGTNELGEWREGIQDYHFSKFGSVWGWATWRRAWDCYDFNISAWGDKAVKERIRQFVGTKHYKHREKVYNSMYKGEIDTWDFQWTFAKNLQHGLTVVPALNQVSNIGFGIGATHTLNLEDPRAKNTAHILKLSMDNKEIVADENYDQLVMIKDVKLNEWLKSAVSRLFGRLGMSHKN